MDFLCVFYVFIRFGIILLLYFFDVIFMIEKVVVKWLDERSKVFVRVWGGGWW